MKKILALMLALSATVLLACPMKDGMAKGAMMGGGCQGCMGEKTQCDMSKLPPRFEALGLSDDQKAQVLKIREDGQAFHAQQYDKMMAVLTPDQQKKFEEVPAMCPKKSLKIKAPAGTACPHCKK